LVGCLSHPGARAYLNKDVIAELERRKTLYIIPGPDFTVGKVEGMDDAIALLRSEVE
jgi:hypothetical protein